MDWEADFQCPSIEYNVVTLRVPLGPNQSAEADRGSLLVSTVVRIGHNRLPDSADGKEVNVGPQAVETISQTWSVSEVAPFQRSPVAKTSIGLELHEVTSSPMVGDP